MHPYVIIPMGATLAASALAGAILARGPRLRANWVLAAMLLCTAGWALCETFIALTDDAAVAIRWLRATTFFGMAFGPLGLLAVAELRPGVREALTRQAHIVLAGEIVLTVLAVATPWVMSEADARGAYGGWHFSFGPLGVPVLGLCAGVPAYAIARYLLAREPGTSSASDRSMGMLGFAVVLPMVIALGTDAVLPMLGVDAPRLATLCLVALGAQFWVHSFRGQEGLISDSGFARAILDDLPDGVALLEQDGVVRAVNDAMARFIGASPSSLIGRRIEELVDAGMDELLTGVEERELLLARDEGEPIPAAVSTVRIHDRQGGVIGLVLLVRDLRAVVGLRRQLVASGRLAAVGELAAGIAHEVNNPISFILANLNELRRHRAAVESHLGEAGVRFESPLGLLAAGGALIDDAQLQIGRVAEIVKEVRTFAHAGTGVRGACNLNELLAAVLRLATLKGGSHAAIESDLMPLPEVVCVSQGMKQVFLSLIRRATAAAGDAGRVRISSRVEDGNAVVRFEDDGLAVPITGPRNLLFDPFDPAVGEWGGLELGISHQLVGQEGGELWLQPLPSGGTCVEVVMPLSAGAAPSRSDEAHP